MMVGPRRRSCRRRLDVRDLGTVQPIAGRKRKYTRKRDVVQRSHSEFSYEQRKKWRRTSKRLRRSNSVVLVSEIPCCRSRKELEKYKRLGLNTALFLSSTSRPRRKQSHISIITISSDDEGLKADRTAEWVASVNEIVQMTPEPELAEMKSDTSLSGNSREDSAKISEDLSQQISELHFPRTPERSESFNPLCVSTPQPLSTPKSLGEFSTNMSFLTNPLNANLDIFRSSQNTYQPEIENPNNKLTTQNPSFLKGFYFGPSVDSRNIELSSLRRVDYNLSNAGFLRQNEDHNNNDEINKQNEECNNTQNNPPYQSDGFNYVPEKKL